VRTYGEHPGVDYRVVDYRGVPRAATSLVADGEPLGELVVPMG
jgi:hypothetical protein